MNPFMKSGCMFRIIRCELASLNAGRLAVSNWPRRCSRTTTSYRRRNWQAGALALQPPLIRLSAYRAAISGRRLRQSQTAATDEHRNAKTFFITTAIYYTNSSPHVGHAYEMVLADVIARYHRLKGEKSFFLPASTTRTESPTVRGESRCSSR